VKPEDVPFPVRTAPPKKLALRVNGARIGAAARPVIDGAASGYVPGLRVLTPAPVVAERYPWEPEE
jgi:hypothetical protein